MNTTAPPPSISRSLSSITTSLGARVPEPVAGSWQVGQRPSVGCFLLFCAIAQALYGLKMSPEGMPVWVMMLCLVAPLAAASISSLTGDLRPLWLVTGTVLAGLGILLLSSYSLPNACKLQEAQNWLRTDRRVIFSAVVNHSPLIRYEYTVGDRVYKSDVIDLLVVPGSVGRAPEVLLAKYPSNAVGSCFFNPNNPAEATLERGWRPAHLQALFPLASLLFGLGLLVSTLRRCVPAATPWQQEL